MIDETGAYQSDDNKELLELAQQEVEKLQSQVWWVENLRTNSTKFHSNHTLIVGPIIAERSDCAYVHKKAKRGVR